MAKESTPTDIARGKRLAALRRAHNLGQAEVAASIGVSRGAVGNWESGGGMSPENEAALARFFSIPTGKLLDSPANEGVISSGGNTKMELKQLPPPIGIPYVGVTEAGAFRMVDLHSDEPTEYVKTSHDHRFPHARHMAFRVIGDSMDLAGILPGDTIIAVDWVDSGATFREGQKVIVERSRDGGMTKETTIKELHIRADGFDLVPVSSNPKHERFFVPRGDADNGVEIRVVALVVSRIEVYSV